jgi:hypothetical protein
MTQLFFKLSFPYTLKGITACDDHLVLVLQIHFKAKKLLNCFTKQIILEFAIKDFDQN